MNDIDVKNAMNLAAWRKRMAARRGSCFLVADSYPDLRTGDQLRQWRTIEFSAAQTGLSKRVRAKVVNLSAWYLRRARNGRQTTLRTA